MFPISLYFKKDLQHHLAGRCVLLILSTYSCKSLQSMHIRIFLYPYMYICGFLLHPLQQKFYVYLIIFYCLLICSSTLFYFSVDFLSRFSIIVLFLLSIIFFPFNTKIYMYIDIFFWFIVVIVFL